MFGLSRLLLIVCGTFILYHIVRKNIEEVILQCINNELLMDNRHIKYVPWGELHDFTAYNNSDLK